MLKNVESGPSVMFPGPVYIEEPNTPEAIQEAAVMAVTPELVYLPRVANSNETDLLDICIEINQTMLNMPLTTIKDKNVIYDLHISPTGDNISAAEGSMYGQKDFYQIEKFLAAFRGGIFGDKKEKDHRFIRDFAHDLLTRNFPEIFLIPSELKALVDEIKRQDLAGLFGDQINVKLQMLGPITTAINMGSIAEGERVVEIGNIIKNHRMMNIHSALIFTR
ncbi:hypothetical protein ACFL1A_00490, partial [Patescibacteria group bacterium]